MNRHTVRAAAAALATAVLVAASPVAAQDTDDTTTTTSTTTTTAVPDGSTSTSTTTTTTAAPGTSSTTTTTTVPVPAPIDPTVAVPTEAVPHGHIDVDTSPPRSGPWDSVAINPALAELVATRSTAALRHADATAALTDATEALTAATGRRERLEGDSKAATAQYRKTRERFSSRVAAMYVSAGDVTIDLRPATDITTDANRVVWGGAITDADATLAAEHLAARDALDGRLAEAIEAEEVARDALDVAKAALAAADLELEAADESLSSTPISVPGFVFPIAGPTSFISSYGFCRDGCRRSHQGNDLFADRGTPLVAVEDGWVEKIGSNRLGGLTVWTRGRSGYRYYYAHLDQVAPLTAGQVIAAGTVVGTVGNTGNAITTPPHLHFEIHPPSGGGAIDPYPILVAAPRVTLAPAAPPTTAPAAAPPAN